MNSIPYKNIPNGTYIESVVSFIEGCLPRFIMDAPIEKKDNEFFLNDSLELFFSYEAKDNDKPYFFKAEPRHRQQTGKPDLGVYIAVKSPRTYTPFFTIEAKRLPPSSEKEYVTGLTGGIARFKRNEHGVDLPVNAMIGYVEKEDYEYWFQQINQWILGLEGVNDRGKSTEKNINWSQRDILEKIYFGTIARCHSKHFRVDSSSNEVMLIHLWIKIKEASVM